MMPESDVLVYADMARWEIQMRFRRNEISNVGVDNRMERASLQYKRGFFVDWRICDRFKKTLMNKWDYVLDTNVMGDPKMATAAIVDAGLKKASKSPFRVVPFFDPGPWGGQWMKEICDLDRETPNLHGVSIVFLRRIVCIWASEKSVSKYRLSIWYFLIRVSCWVIRFTDVSGTSSLFGSTSWIRWTAVI